MYKTPTHALYVQHYSVEHKVHVLVFCTLLISYMFRLSSGHLQTDI